MTAILGFSDQLAASTVGQREQREFLAAIRRNGESLMELVNAILKLSRGDAGPVDDLPPAAPAGPAATPSAIASTAPALPEGYTTVPS